MESDAVYFRRRASEELLAASKADHPAARHSHLDMAARYRDLAFAIDGDEGSPADEPGENAPRPRRNGIWF